MVVVYELKKNQRYIDQVQHATLTTKEFGIESTHGLFGSDEWWRAIAFGQLPIHTQVGTISKVYMGSMNDWPMFDLLTDTGEKSSWTREVNFSERDSLYRAGSRVEIDYVWQNSRPKSWSKGAEQKQVLEIRIADLEAS